MRKSQRISHLKFAAQVSLFGVSYLPLFLIIVAQTIFNNKEYLFWGGINKSALSLCVEHFGIALGLLIFIFCAYLGTQQTFKKIHEHKENGFRVSVHNVSSKSAETINYIATYIIPFIYDVDSLFKFSIMIFLVAFIFLIYINSSLLVVNPVLAIKYGVFEIEYQEGNILRSAIVISPNKHLLEGDCVKLYEIGHKLYFCF